MNQIGVQQSEQSKTEKILSLSASIRSLTAENTRLKLYLIQLQSEQEHEFLAAKKSAMLMQRYISIMDLSLQYSTRHLLLARGEVPTEQKVDHAALQLTRSVSAIVEKIEMQQLREQRLQQQVQHQQQRSTGGLQQQSRKGPSLQQSNKMLSHTQTGATRNSLMQKMRMGPPLGLRGNHQNNSQMFSPKPMGMVPGKASALNNNPLLHMQKQLYPNRMKSAMSNQSARGNNMVGGGAFGATPRNPNLPFSGLHGFSGGNVNDKSSAGGGLARGLPSMSSSLMNTMKYMPGMKGLNNPMSESKPSLLGGMGGMENSLSAMSAHLGKMARTGAGMDTPNSVGGVSNGIAGLPGMRGANLPGLKDMLDTPNNRQIPVGQKLLQQTVLNHMLQSHQSSQQQKKRQAQLQTPMNALPTPALKRVKLDPSGSLVKPVDLLPKNLSVDLTKAVPKLQTPASSTSATNSVANSSLIHSATPSQTVGSQLDAASTLTRMLDDREKLDKF